MDWTRAIEINRAALMPILAELLALLEVFADTARLPLPVYRRTAWTLGKIESAVRRLIVIAARGLVAQAPPRRPMPEGLVIAAAAPGAQARMAFPLFDPRRSFADDSAPSSAGPRIRMLGDPSPREQFLSQFPAPPRGLSTIAQTRALRLRLAAVERALAHLTREARRLARWRARRMRLQNPSFIDVMRPGPPPGINRTSRSDIDLILRECHDLAFHALREDSS